MLNVKNLKKEFYFKNQIYIIYTGFTSYSKKQKTVQLANWSVNTMNLQDEYAPNRATSTFGF